MTKVEGNIVSEEKLPIHGLADRHRGLSQPIGEAYTEAARVCLDRHQPSPVDFRIEYAGLERDATTEWEGTDERTRNAWANDTDATEAGAYACALAALELARGMIAVRRAETKTGADYYVALPGGGEEDLEDCIRFEVSGVDAGAISRLRHRLQVKLDQAASGESNLPAMAGIVGFKAKRILLKKTGR